MRIVFTFTFLWMAFAAQAQAEYTITRDPNNAAVKVFTGTINKYLVQNDSSFDKWYAPNYAAYTPQKDLLARLAVVNLSGLQLVVFGGTWCEDTQFILPRFFKLQEISGISDNNITFFGVNRNKKALGHIAEAFAVVNVPTIIVLKNGQELGRVVEYGKTGQWDKELVDIISKPQ